MNCRFYLTPITSRLISLAFSSKRRAVFKSAPNFIENRQTALVSSVTMRKTSLEERNEDSFHDQSKDLLG